MINERMVSGKELGEIINISYRQVAYLYNKDVLIKRKGYKTKYPLYENIQRYIEYLTRDKLSEKSITVKNRSLIARAVKLERENNLAKTQFLDKDDVQMVFNEAMIIVGTQMDTLPDRVCVELSKISEPAEIRKTILDETRKIRSDAAERLKRMAVIENNNESGNK